MSQPPSRGPAPGLAFGAARRCQMSTPASKCVRSLAWRPIPEPRVRKGWAAVRRRRVRCEFRKVRQLVHDDGYGACQGSVALSIVYLSARNSSPRHTCVYASVFKIRAPREAFRPPSRPSPKSSFSCSPPTSFLYFGGWPTSESVVSPTFFQQRPHLPAVSSY